MSKNNVPPESGRNKKLDNRWTVYVHINKVNKKKYVGITKQKPERRWQNGYGYKYNSTTYFWNAICKYSWDGFEHIILENGLSFEEAK